MKEPGFNKATFTGQPDEDYYRLLFESNPNPMWFYDLETLRFLDVNEAAVIHYGFTRDEFLNLTISDIRPPEDIATLLDAVTETRHGLKTYDRAWRHRKRDGTIINVKITSHKLTITGRAAVLVLAQDVTEQQSIEERLRESEARYRTVIDATFGGIVVHDEGVILDANQGAAAMFGVEPERMIGTHILDYTAPESREEVVRNVRAGVEHSYIASALRADGSSFTVELFGMSYNYFGRRARVTALLDITDRKLAEEALRKSEERFQLAARATNDAIYDFDLLTDELWWNEGVRTLFGYREEDVATHLAWWDAKLHPEDRERVNTSLRSAIGGGATSWTEEYRFRRADGSYAYILDRGYIVHDDHGTPVRMIGAMIDFTERRHAEDELRQREKHFRALIENSTDLVNVLSAEGIIIYENPSSERQLGYVPNEVVGESAFSLIHPDDMPRARETFSHVMARPGETALMRFRLRHKDGSWRHLEATAKNLLHDPAVAGIVVNSRDVTERERIAAERDAERRILDALIDQLPVGVMFRDPQGHYTRVNQQFATILGVDREVVVGMTGDDILRLIQARTLEGEAVLSAEDTPSSAAIRKGHAVEPREYLITTPTGEVRHANVAATPVKVGDELLGTVIVGDDVTEQRRVQEQLRQAQKMEAIGRLAGGVAHDFNNLLTAITGYSDMLLRRTDMSSVAYNHVEQIRRAADRAAALTQQLLAFSRKQMMQTRVMNLNKTVAELEGILRRLIGENIRLEMRFAGDPGSIIADPHQIEQVVINLAVNARDAMPEGGHLVIETRHEDVHPEAAERRHGIEPNQYCLLVVRDTGHGMSNETQSRIFEPFYTTKDVGKGTGLGLSTVYGIVKQSGGHIIVESELGQGTTFKVYLTCVEEQPEASQKQTAHKPQRAPGTETILLVEDEELVRRMTSEVLRLQGYTVIEAEHGRRALEVFRDNDRRIDLMITDVVMPEMSGTQLAQKALILRPELRVLFMSGYTEEAVAQGGVPDANVAFIHKPWTPDALLAKVREVLEAK